MPPTPQSQYVESRNGGYYVAGSRVSLDTVVYAFRRGESPETILEHFPAIHSLAKIYGAIAFLLDHAPEVEAYLAQQELRWEQGRQQNPARTVDAASRARRYSATPSA